MNRCVLFVAALSAACSYDVSRLGPADVTQGGIDVTVVDDFQPSMDAHGLDVPEGGIRTDAQLLLDVPLTPCSDTHVTTAMGTMSGPSMVIEASTVGGESRLTAPQDDAGCPSDYSTMPSPERVYRYIMQGTSGRLVATTDSPACTARFDTVVYLRTACEPGTGTVIGCNDDDHVLQSCSCATGTCLGLESTAVATGIAQGSSVFVVVDGYHGASGDFRLTLTEGAATDEAPPDTGSGLMLADRCVCAAASALSMHELTPFPSSADHYNTGSSLSAEGNLLSGSHATALTHLAGVALDITMTHNGLTDSGCPAGATAIVDLLINARVVQSFDITPDMPAPGPLRVAYQTFGSFTLGGSPVSIALRLRSITAGCGALQFDTSGTGQVLMVGNAT